MAEEKNPGGTEGETNRTEPIDHASRASVGEWPEDLSGQRAIARGAARRATAVGVLLTALLVTLGTLDPFLLLPYSGLLTGAGLFVSQRLSPVWASAMLAVAAGIGFAAGHLAGGLVIASALAVAAVYPLLQRRVRGEDDHFFLATLCNWLFLGAGVGLAFLIAPPAAAEMLHQVVKEWRQGLQDMAPLLQQWLGPPGDSSPILKWVNANPGIWLTGAVIFCQSLITYFAVKWVRVRLNWPNSLRSRFIFFRLGVPYAFVLAAALLLLVLAPFVRTTNLQAIAVPILLWFSAGCLLAGLSCGVFLLTALRLSGRLRAAQLYQIIIILLILLTPYVFVLVGLTDIWLDVRKLTTARGVFVGKGDS